MRGGTIELYTSFWRNPALANLACQPVQISRGRPRGAPGFRYRVARELAPDDRAWSHSDWAGFVASYRCQLDELGLDAIVSRLARISEQAGGLFLALLCFESSPADCHRGLLSRWLGERGVEVCELQPGDLPRRADSPEPRLFDPDQHRREETT